MPTKLVEDKRIRYVSLEHECASAGLRFRGFYYELPGRDYVYWGKDMFDQNSRRCPGCGEELPQKPPVNLDA